MGHEEGQKIDVVILGGGMAGLTLARHLLLETDQRVLMLEKRDELPQKKQKVGESTVQLAGYYLSKVLDLEQHLLHEHFMKYNLRFYWHGQAGDGSGGGAAGGESIEDYSSAFIRPFSNIASYQVDRNVLEGELQRLCLADPRFRLEKGVRDLEVDLAEPMIGKAAEEVAGEALHEVRFTLQGEEIRVRARWLVDSTGRRRLIAKKRQLQRPAPIRHGSFFWWVEGLVDVERLSDLDRTARRRHSRRRQIGHTPHWLATNHFCDRGLWFWIIPLRGKTSLGLVFDHSQVEWQDVSNVERATRFICQRFPLLARDLPERKVIDIGGYKDFSYDCVQTLSAARWAMTGESGRFSDPLYSPGSDLIAIHNTLIVHAMGLEDPEQRKSFCQLSESLLKATYHAYVPGYVETYDCLGDEECFSLKYIWELTIYFAFYVFPFINDLFTERRFVVGFLRQFARLGAWNRGILKLLAGYAEWLRMHRKDRSEPVHMDFMEVCALRRAEKTFYEVDASASAGKRVLSQQMENLEELARFLAVHIAAEVIGEPAAKTDRAFIETFDIENLDFLPQIWTSSWQEREPSQAAWQWHLDVKVFDRFRTARRATTEASEASQKPAELFEVMP